MRIHYYLTAIAVSLTLATSASGAEIQRMDPPFWYTGMKNHELQVMFYGKGIAESGFSMKDYAGVTVKEVAKVGNPNYLFVYLDISSEAGLELLYFVSRRGGRPLRRLLSSNPATQRQELWDFPQRMCFT